MNNFYNNYLNCKIFKYFDKKLLNDKNLRDNLISFEEILSIKKNIRKIFGSDKPIYVKKLIGKKINGVSVTDKDFNYVNLINKTYNDLYFKCTNLLKEKKID